ncbi:MAG: hypothetical protein LBS36_06675 [Oscillospiraceae bacterium]|jgi:hypothetical protein|nr:hypothetical protein [Oscillospiraceae bacterium]
MADWKKCEFCGEVVPACKACVMTAKKPSDLCVRVYDLCETCFDRILLNRKVD